VEGLEPPTPGFGVREASSRPVLPNNDQPGFSAVFGRRPTRSVTTHYISFYRIRVRNWVQLAGNDAGSPENDRAPNFGCGLGGSRVAPGPGAGSRRDPGFYRVACRLPDRRRDHNVQQLQRHGRRRRQVESEWDKLQAAARAFCSTRPELRDINVGLMFSGPAPPRRLHADFIKEVAVFIATHRHELRSEDVDYWPPTISTPLMVEYLQVLYLRVDRYAVWYSNLTAGFVATPATSAVADIVADKSARNFRPADELWLAIQCSTRISETLLPIETNDFDMVPALDGFRFSRVFVLTYLGVYEWKVGEGWHKLTGDPDRQFSGAASLSARAG
jgi:hypothetical protein